MLEKLAVPTRLKKNYLLKYLDKDSPLMPPPKIKKKHTPYYSNILCKFYSKNGCAKGDDCIFSHELTQFNTEEVQCLHDEKEMFISPFNL